MDSGYGELVGLGGVTLFVRRFGAPDGVPLVVIHGGPDWDHSYLLPALELVAQSRPVVAYDLRGCGRSTQDLPLDSLQPEFIVDDTSRLVDWLGVPEIDLLGFSTGGQVAMLFAEQHPARLRRLVLASTTAYPDYAEHLTGWTELRERSSDDEQAAVFADQTLTDAEVTRRWAELGAPTSVWDQELIPAYLELLSRVRFTGNFMPHLRIGGTLHPWRPTDPGRVLRDLGKPIMILHGAQDMGFPVQVARRLHAAVPASELVIVDQAGHMAQFERPSVWAAHVRTFLE